MKKILISVLFSLTLLISVSVCAENVSGWAADDYNIFKDCGVLYDDLLYKDGNTPVTRFEFSKLMYNAYLQNHERPVIGDTPFSDINDISITSLYTLGIVSGDENANFNGNNLITRQEACAILSRFYTVSESKGLLAVESSLSKFKDISKIADWAIPYASKLAFAEIIQGTGEEFMPSTTVTLEQSCVFINRIAKLGKKQILLSSEYDGDVINLDWSGVKSENYKVNVTVTRNSRHFDETGSDIKTYETSDTNFVLKADPVRVYEITVSSGQYISNKVIITTYISDYYNTQTQEILSENIKLINEYYEKENEKLRNEAELNGEDFEEVPLPDKNMPTTKEEADYLQTKITVPVWKVGSNGNKYSSNIEIVVHKKIADKLSAVFKEIYNGKEKFPIESVCYYGWRGDGGEHNIGTAIDINPDQNYCLYTNGTVVGKFWKPYDNIYSITPFGEVVKAFEKYGFNWGADTWRGNRDYMHFSYMGT